MADDRSEPACGSGQTALSAGNLSQKTFNVFPKVYGCCLCRLRCREDFVCGAVGLGDRADDLLKNGSNLVGTLHAPLTLRDISPVVLLCWPTDAATAEVYFSISCIRPVICRMASTALPVDPERHESVPQFPRSPLLSARRAI